MKICRKYKRSMARLAWVPRVVVAEGWLVNVIITRRRGGSTCSTQFFCGWQCIARNIAFENKFFVLCLAKMNGLGWLVRPCFDIPSTSLLRDSQAPDMARQSYLASLRHRPGTTASDNPCKGMPRHGVHMEGRSKHGWRTWGKHRPAGSSVPWPLAVRCPALAGKAVTRQRAEGNQLLFAK